MKTLFAFAVSLILLSACSPKVTKGEQYAKLYQEGPESVVIMQPSNRSNVPEAADYLYTTLHKPISDKGYRVVPADTTIDFLSADIDIRFLKKRLGADAALFTIIKTWNKSGLAGQINVGVEYILQSTVTNEVLFSREGLVTVDTSDDSSEGGFLGVALSIAATAANTFIAGYETACRKCNESVLGDLPVAKNRSDYVRDQKRRAGERYVEETVKW